ncbi:hypothetical protein Glove_114g98 [Diversispora epigaea]|uniref:Uncharacterized protein n=1 Tax=Diversispora epigaea TaxID=1348612 RepID=A0A397JBA4_9GLOM|nr:hypothetical protein Glove_114g98 [Diversispora epigaea]
MESNWEKVDKKITDLLPQVEDNMRSLLEKYNKAIRDSTFKCFVDLNKVEDIICNKSPFEDHHSYIILCLHTPFNPLCDPTASEYMYRSRIINHLWKELFLNVNCIATIKTHKVGNKFVQVAFGEVIGNTFKCDNKKFNNDKEKMLKAMQLALFNLRKSLPEKTPDLEDLETFGLLTVTPLVRHNNVKGRRRNEQTDYVYKLTGAFYKQNRNQTVVCLWT